MEDCCGSETWSNVACFDLFPFFLSLGMCVRLNVNWIFFNFSICENGFTADGMHSVMFCIHVCGRMCVRVREREREFHLCAVDFTLSWFYRAATNFMCLNSLEFTTESEHKTLAFLCACQKYSHCTRLAKEIDNMNHNYMYPILFQTTSQCCHPLRSFFHSIFLLDNWFRLSKCCFLPSPMTSSKKFCAQFQ